MLNKNGFISVEGRVTYWTDLGFDYCSSHISFMHVNVCNLSTVVFFVDSFAKVYFSLAHRSLWNRNNKWWINTGNLTHIDFKSLAHCSADLCWFSQFQAGRWRSAPLTSRPPQPFHSSRQSRERSEQYSEIWVFGGYRYLPV